jgi:hypothetical protein
MGIAIVTSTHFSGATSEKFFAGLRSKGWEADPGSNPGSNRPVSLQVYEADGKYDDGDGGVGRNHELYNAVAAYNADAGVQLIIATGGLVSAHAAWKKSTKPFIVLFGNTPSFVLGSNPELRGGVNLDMVVKNNDRNAALCRMAGVTDPKKVCLIWNSRSKMGKVEQRAWTANGWPLDQQVRINSDAAITSAFAQAKASRAQGIVISGDPYFTSRMGTVVAAANGSQLKICYPFAAYANATPAPTSGIYLGPDLPAAYEQIGQMAGEILNAFASGVTAPNLGLVTAPSVGPNPIAKRTAPAKKRPPSKKKTTPKRKPAAKRKMKKK